MINPEIKTGSATIINGETVVNFDTSFNSLPRVICSSKIEDINIYVKNITLSNFTVASSSPDTFDIDYIAIKE